MIIRDVGSKKTQNLEGKSRSVLIIGKQLEREKLMEKLFEGEGFTSVQFAFPTQTSLLGAGLVNGICIDSGRTSTLISLIREGYIVENILKPVGGNTLSEEIMNIYKIPQKLANQLKKKCCVTQLEMGAQKMRIQLPDGQTITFKHRNDVPELLFSEHQLHLLPFTHQDVVLSGENGS